MNERWVAVLGRRDEPTDALEHYCQYLASALMPNGIALELFRVAWPEKGWRRALQDLREKAHQASDTWYLVEYTALAWSRRGFPLRVLNVIRTLKENNARCAVVFHDANPYSGSRLMDRFRRRVQLHTMQKAVRMADLVILTVPADRAEWLPKASLNVTYIPVGANLPHPESAWRMEKREKGIPTVAVFSISVSSPTFVGEGVKRVAAAVCYASSELGPLRLAVVGRNSEVAGKQLRELLAGTQVEVIVHGLLAPQEIQSTLGASDVLLFVGGPISSRRGSAIAGIACGLPVVAYEGQETAGTIKEAGVVLVARDLENGLGQALVRVLQNEAYRQALQERSRRAQKEFFSWETIAERYLSALRS